MARLPEEYKGIEVDLVHVDIAELEARVSAWLDPPVCPYCGEKAHLVDGSVPYPHLQHLHSHPFWYCANGHEEALVGCHAPNPARGFFGVEPLGTLATKELRQLRAQAHNAFDPLWQLKLFPRNRRVKPRGVAYRWLAEALGLTRDECHIGLFNEDQCRKAIALCKSKHRVLLIERANND